VGYYDKKVTLEDLSTLARLEFNLQELTNQTKSKLHIGSLSTIVGKYHILYFASLYVVSMGINFLAFACKLYKACEPYVVTTLNQIHVFGWYMTRFVVNTTNI
jgi:hypothetical protein